MVDTQELYNKVLRCTPERFVSLKREEIAFGILLGGGNQIASDMRMSDAAWQQYTEQVWVAGMREQPGYTQVQIKALLQRGHVVPSALHVQEDAYAAHTPAQTNWFCQLIKSNPMIRGIILSAAEYHTSRGGLTFVKSWMKLGDDRKLQIAVAPTRNPPQDHSTGKTSGTMADELERIKRYYGEDVATAEEFEAFLAHSR